MNQELWYVGLLEAFATYIVALVLGVLLIAALTYLFAWAWDFTAHILRKIRGRK